MAKRLQLDAPRFFGPQNPGQKLDGNLRQGNSKMKVVRTIRGYLALFLHAVTGRVAKPDSEVSVEKPVLHKSASGQ